MKTCQPIREDYSSDHKCLTHWTFSNVKHILKQTFNSKWDYLWKQYFSVHYENTRVGGSDTDRGKRALTCERRCQGRVCLCVISWTHSEDHSVYTFTYHRSYLLLWTLLSGRSSLSVCPLFLGFRTCSSFDSGPRTVTWRWLIFFSHTQETGNFTPIMHNVTIVLL